MKKLTIAGLLVVVLLFGVDLYLRQARDVNAAGTLSMEEMGKITGGRWRCSRCDGSCSCGGGTTCKPIGGGGSALTKKTGPTSYPCCASHLFCSGTCNGSSITCGTISFYSKPGCSEGYEGSQSITYGDAC